MTKYSNLFSPIKIGSRTLKNRFLMGPVKTGLEGRDEFANEWVNFYQSRCTDHGPGLFIINHGAMSFSGRDQLDAPVTDNKFFNKAFRLNSFLRSRGSEVMLQLMHHGMDAAHFGAVSSSGLINNDTLYKSHRIPNLFVEHFIKGYALLAAQAVTHGGFSGVEIYGGKLSLPNTFTSPVLNKRTDQWGGEKRFKFATEIVRRIRDYIGPTPLLSYRLTLMDLLPGGNRWDDLVDFAAALAYEGVDMLSFDIGLLSDSIPLYNDLTPKGIWYPFIENFSAETELPVVLLPPEAAPDEIEASLGRDAKAVAEVAHELIADPQWGEKLYFKSDEELIPCVGCASNCITSTLTREHTPLCCIANPYAVFPFTVSRKELRTQGNCLIIGGGPAGMAAAEHAARRGLNTVLVEERPVLGGMLHLASMIPGKEHLQDLIRLKEEHLLKLGVEIIKGVRASGIWIRENYPHYKVFLATGTQPVIPDIPGIDSLNVLTFEDLLLRKASVGHRVAIIGDSRIALDIARYLVTDDKPLTSEEWLRAWGIGDPRKHRAGCQGMIPFIDTLPRSTYIITDKELRQLKESLREAEKLTDMQWIRMNGVQTLSESLIDTIDTVSVRVLSTKDSTPTIYRIDHIIIADELEPRDELQKALEEEGKEFTAIGSLKEPAKLFGGALNAKSGINAVEQVFFKK